MKGALEAVETRLQRNRNPQYYCRKITLMVLALLITLIGCEGDPGSPGENRLGDDVFAPTIELIQPFARTQVHEGLWLEAKVTDTGIIDSVEFLTNSFPVSENRLVIREAPFQLYWSNIDLLPGNHFIQAIVWDQAGHTGLSEAVLIEKIHPDSVSSREDVVTFFNSNEDTQIEWILPDPLLPEEGNVVSGFGVRFNLNQPAVFDRLYFYVKKYDSWFGALWNVEFRQVENGMPGDIIGSRVLEGNVLWRPDAVPENRTVWKSLKIPAISELPLEFFVTVTMEEDQGAQGDTLAFFTDNGKWKNGHSLVLIDGEWQSFASGSSLEFNPMIRLQVEYLRE